MEKASFQAHLRYLLATDIAAFLFAALLVLIASRIRAIISPLAVVIVIAAFAVAFAGDVALWLYRGIRSIDLDDQTLTLFRGMDLKAQSFTRETVAGVEIKRRFLRRMVILRLSRIRAVRITEEAFPHETFNNFLEAISGWGQRN
ncbi:MAG: hypothetical protein ABSG17_08665 [Spirochaetia bacterium]|jgi:hypothetical protein